MSRISQKKGESLELLTLNRLRASGCFVDRIATPVKVIKGKTIRTKKVLGDIIGLNQNGIGLLCECKNRNRLPRPSDFEPHQIETLEKWGNMGGVALVSFNIGGELNIDNACYIFNRSNQ